MKILQITLFLYLAIFLTSRVGTLIHEVLGHGLSSVLVGGNITGFSINLFTTGSCSYELLNPELAHRVIVDLAGITVNILSGITCLIILRRIRFHWEIKIMLCILAMVSIGSQLTYLVLGTYYGHGDPLILEELFGSWKWLVWGSSLILMAPAAYFLTGSFLRLQEEVFPCSTLKARASILIATFIAASVMYGGCFIAENRTTGFLGGMATFEQKITEKANKAIDDQFLTKEEKILKINTIKRKLRPFPITVSVCLISLLSGSVAFLRTNDRPSPSRHHNFRTEYLWGSLFVSLVVGALIVLVL